MANPPITVGELSNVPAPGSGVKSAWAQDVTNRILQRFATAAARAAAYTAPGRGAASYVQSNDASEGPEYWDGTAWRKPWNMPWGVVGWGRNIAGGGSYTTGFTDVPGLAATWTAVANRLYRVSVSAMFNSIVGAAVIVQLTDAANGTLNQCNLTPNSIVSAQQATFITLFTPSPGSYSVKVRCSTGSGTTTLQSSPTFPAFLIVEDAGPALGTPA